MARSARSAKHAKAFDILVKGLRDPAKMAPAKRNRLLKPIIAKLSNDDIKVMRTMAQSVSESVCQSGSGGNDGESET
jgi:hypothetical protein